MPTLTITADTRGVSLALRGVNSLIDKATESSIRLAGVSSTIAGHWNAASVAAREYSNRLQTIQRQTQDIARQTASIRPPGVDPRFGGNAAGAARAAAQAAREQAQAQTRAASAAARQARSLAQASRSASIVRRELEAASRIRPRSVSPGGPAGLIGGGGGSGVIDVSGTSRIISSGVGGGIGQAIRSVFRGGGAAVKAITSGFQVAGVAAFAAGPVVGGIASAFTGAISGIASTLTSIIGTAWEASMAVLRPALTATVGAALVAGGFSLQQALAAEPVRQGFEALVNSRGLGDADEVTARLRAASRGTISDRGLQLNAASALSLGAADNIEQVELLIDSGRRLGRVFGRTATEAFNDLSLGIGRQSKLILDNLGLVVKLGDANRSLSEELKKPVAQFTEQERRLAFNVAAYDAIIRKSKELGEEQLTAADQLSRVGASIQNLAAQIGSRALPFISQLADKWVDFIKTLEPDRIVSFVQDGLGALSNLGGRIFDTIFGDGAFGEGLRGIGGSIASFIQDPSIAAFKTVGVEFQRTWDISVAYFQSIWDTALDRLKIAYVEVGAVVERSLISGALSAVEGIERVLGVDAFAKFFGVDSLRERLGGVLSDIGTEVRSRFVDVDAARARVEQAAVDREARIKAINAAADEQVKALRSSSRGVGDSAWNDAGEVLLVAAGKAASGLTTVGETTAKVQEQLRASVAGLQAEEDSRKAVVAAQKEAIEAQKTFLDGQLEGIKIEQEGRERLIAITEREIGERERSIASFAAAERDITRALAGLGAYQSLEDQARTLAAEFRRFPDAIQDAEQSIKDAQDAYNQTVREVAEERRDAEKAVNDAIRDAARAFLGQDAVEGQNVASRAAQRRFQRDRDRAQRRAINEAFQAPSFQSFEGNFGGFGAQNIDRQGGAFRNLDRRAEIAVRALEALQGDGVIRQAEEALIRLNEENLRRIEEGRDAVREEVAKKLEIVAAQEATNAELVELRAQLGLTSDRQAKQIEEMIAILRATREEVASEKARGDRLEQALRALR